MRRALLVLALLASPAAAEIAPAPLKVRARTGNLLVVPTLAQVFGPSSVPGGSIGSVQYNNSGAFGGVTGFTLSAGTLQSIDLANTDTTLTRSAAGIMAVEGKDLLDVSSSQTITAGTKTFQGGTLTVKSTGSGNPAYLPVPALTALTGADVICIGTGSCASLTSSISSVIIGSNAGDGATSGIARDTFLGMNTGTGSNIGADNTCVGYAACDQTTSTAATNNTAVGVNALGGLTSGVGNTSIGTDTCTTVTSNNNNICVGNGATPATTSLANTVNVGVSAQAAVSNQVAWGGAGTPYSAGMYGPEGVTDTSATNLIWGATGGSGSDNAGAAWIREGGKATGNAAGGDVVDQTSVKGSTGSTAQSMGDRTRILGKYTDITDATATAIVRCNVPSGTSAGGMLLYTTEARDAGNEQQARSGLFVWAAANKAGTTTVGLSAETQAVGNSSGTLPCTATAVDSGSGNVDFKVNCDTSLTSTTLRTNAAVWKNFGTGTCSAQ